MSAAARCVECGVIFANFDGADATWDRFKNHECFKGGEAAPSKSFIALALAGRMQPLPGGMA